MVAAAALLPELAIPIGSTAVTLARTEWTPSSAYWIAWVPVRRLALTIVGTSTSPSGRQIAGSALGQ